MYICICKAVTDGQIKQAIHEGACTRKQLIECLNVGRDCGKCNADVRELLTIHVPQKTTSPCGHSNPLAA